MDPVNDQVAGWSWPAGGSVLIEVFDGDPAVGGVLDDSWPNVEVVPDEPGNAENPFGSFWLNLGELDPVFDLVPGMFVRVSDEDVGDPVLTKETVVLDLSVDVPVLPSGGVVTGTGDAVEW